MAFFPPVTRKGLTIKINKIFTRQTHINILGVCIGRVEHFLHNLSSTSSFASVHCRLFVSLYICMFIRLQNPIWRRVDVQAELTVLFICIKNNVDATAVAVVVLLLLYSNVQPHLNALLSKIL